jgi:hypothetical protein
MTLLEAYASFGIPVIAVAMVVPFGCPGAQAVSVLRVEFSSRFEFPVSTPCSISQENVETRP